MLRRAFVDDTLATVDALAQATAAGCDVIVGFVDRSAAGVHNAAAVLQGGAVTARYAKCKLPNYGVFDERRTFVAGTEGVTVEVAGTDVGLSICEDAWEPGPPFDRYVGTPIVANLNGSPFHRGKVEERADVLRARAAETGAWIVYVNAVGGQDELVFDGGSLVVAPDGSVACRAARFDEDLLVVQIDDDGFAAEQRPPWPAEPEEVYRALVLGTRDYVHKNGFQEVVLGLSGGVDSAFVATIAVDALGRRCGARPGDAQHVLEPRQHHRCRGCGGPPRHPARNRCDHRRLPSLREATRRPARGRGPRRREPPGTHPGQRPDGAVEPIRLARARDRQQERVRRRLLDAVRRHGRRLRTGEGRTEDAPVRAVRRGATRWSRRRRSPTRS